MRKTLCFIAGFAVVLVMLAARYVMQPLRVEPAHSAVEAAGSTSSLHGPDHRAELVPVVARKTGSKVGVDPAQPALSPLVAMRSVHPGDRSPLADDLLKAESNGTHDLRIVLNLFESYRQRFGGIPTGEDNATVVNALSGNNPRRLAFIAREHPAINARGEMIDRWGTPLFFHIESRDALEIRSAGPDCELWTGDDLLERSASLAAKNGA